MTKTNVIKCDFSKHKAQKSSTPPATGVNVSMTRKVNGLRVVTNLSNLSADELLWALIGDASEAIKQQVAAKLEKQQIINNYIAN